MALRDIIPASDLIGVDTAPLIYYIEGGSPLDHRVVELFEECLDSGRNRGVTSVVTLAEVLVMPVPTGNPDLAARYREILTRNRSLQLSSLSPAIAERAAELRAAYNVKLPDALQFAAASAATASHWITNDDGFPRLDGGENITVHVLSRLVG